jgi:hypothetical protein
MSALSLISSRVRTKSPTRRKVTPGQQPMLGWRRYLQVYHLDQNRALFLANRNWPCGQGGMIPLVLG